MTIRPTVTITRSVGRAAAAVTVAAGLAVGLALPAAAATAPTRPSSSANADPAKALGELQAAGAAAISQRQAQLTKLSTRLDAAPSCDAGGRIAGVIAADGPALADLGAELAADTTVAEARADVQSIFDDFRVYLVVTPQAYATAACGHIDEATTTLTADQAKLQERVDAAVAGGADMTAAQAALTDMGAKLADATAKGDQAATSLAALEPDHGDKAVITSNAAAVDAAHALLVTAHADLTTAADDARTVVAALKALG